MNSDHARQNRNAEPQVNPNGRFSGTHKRRQEEAVFGGEPHPYIGAELSLQDHDLMTQSENLDILVTIAPRQ